MRESELEADTVSRIVRTLRSMGAAATPDEIRTVTARVLAAAPRIQKKRFNNFVGFCARNFAIDLLRKRVWREKQEQQARVAADTHAAYMAEVAVYDAARRAVADVAIDLLAALPPQSPRSRTANILDLVVRSLQGGPVDDDELARRYPGTSRNVRDVWRKVGRKVLRDHSVLAERFFTTYRYGRCPAPS